MTEDDSVFRKFVNTLEFGWEDSLHDSAQVENEEQEIREIEEVEWSVHKIGERSSNVRRIEAGEVNFVHNMNAQYEYLAWRATLPEFFIPGQTSLSLVEFERLFFYEIPKKLGTEFKSEDDAVDAFRKESKIQMTGRGREPKKYDFFRFGDYHKFVADFLKPDEGYIPQSMRVHPKRRNFNTESNLVITYGEFDRLEGEIGIHLPRGRSGAPWTEHVLEWALQTHRNAPQVTDDPAAARKLLQTLVAVS
jgi:hypothetical protein